LHELEWRGQPLAAAPLASLAICNRSRPLPANQIWPHIVHWAACLQLVRRLVSGPSGLCWPSCSWPQTRASGPIWAHTSRPARRTSGPHSRSGPAKLPAAKLAPRLISGARWSPLLRADHAGAHTPPSAKSRRLRARRPLHQAGASGQLAALHLARRGLSVGPRVNEIKFPTMFPIWLLLLFM